MSFYLQSFSSFQYKHILFIAPDRINHNVWMMLKKRIIFSAFDPDPKQVWLFFHIQLVIM